MARVTPPTARPRGTRHRLGQAHGGLHLLLLTLLCVACSGCGYRTERIEAFPMARTVAVTPFVNKGFRRDLELHLTQAVVDEVRSSTSYAIGSPTTADLVISGEMLAWEQVTTLTKERQPLQKRLGGRIDVVLTERATGRVLKRTSVWTWAEYLAEDSLDAQRATAGSEWVRRAARQVAEVLESGF